MNHSPNPLALLISLIGVGVSPAVQARVDEPRVGAPVSLPGVNCTEAAAALLPACGDGLGLSWQQSYGAVHGVGPGSLRRATPPQTQALADAPGVLAEPGVNVDEPTVERVEVIPVTDAATASARFDRMMASLAAVLTDAPLPAAPATAEPTVCRYATNHRPALLVRREVTSVSLVRSAHNARSDRCARLDTSLDMR